MCALPVALHSEAVGGGSPGLLAAVRHSKLRERSSRIALRSRSQVLGTLCLEKPGEPPPLQKKRTFLVIQWLRPCSPNAEGPGQIPGQETRSHMPPLRPDAAK